jgi:hypothetical protein
MNTRVGGIDKQDAIGIITIVKITIEMIQVEVDE